MGDIAAMKADPDYQALVRAELQRDQARTECDRYREALKQEETDTRRDAEVCTCDHDIWAHAAQAPQWCTVKDCRCPTLFTKAQAAELR